MSTGGGAGRPIVVGVDGSPGALSALRFALEEGRLHEATVRVLYAWALPVVDVPPTMVPTLYEDLRDEAQKVLDEAIAAVNDSGSVPIERVLVEGAPAEELVEAAKDAELLVVGSRGRGGFTGLLLGSVGQHCLQHAPCPVVVVPTPQE